MLTVASKPSTSKAQHNTALAHQRALCTVAHEPGTFAARAIPVGCDLNSKSLTILFQAEESPSAPSLFPVLEDSSH